MLHYGKDLKIDLEDIEMRLEIEYGLVIGYTGAPIAPMLRVKKDNFFIAPAYEVTGNVGVVIGLEFNLK